ncbi:alpha/beta fold hydrolase [Streptomyces sp. LN245]|uniref:alpha/beta fold hydrolase n=1 Tax=Streptomyces sp. LN245 TaxID=3112975 RepID=UPI003711A948
MFRHLIPALADRYRVIAPDHIGSDSQRCPASRSSPTPSKPSPKSLPVSCSNWASPGSPCRCRTTAPPIGWRLALQMPERITRIITQNGNAYEEGFVKPFWDGRFAYAQSPGPDTEAPVRGALTAEITRWQYVNGVSDPSLVSPDNWVHDQALLDRPGNDVIQLKLFRDYPTNVDLYPQVHQYFRDSQVPLLAVWGANDEIFGPAGAEAFAEDLPDAEIHLLDSGHFALESHLGAITGHIRGFLDRVLP